MKMVRYGLWVQNKNKMDSVLKMQHLFGSITDNVGLTIIPLRGIWWVVEIIRNGFTCHRKVWCFYL